MPTLNLSKSSWQFRDTTDKNWLPARVPGCVHTDLRRAKKIPDPFYGNNELDLQWIEERDWEYRTTFKVSAKLLAEEVVELAADGLDTVATVYLNGKQLASTDNMFIGYRWSMKPQLVEGDNELRIVFTSALSYIRTTRSEFVTPNEFNDPVGNSVRIRKQQCQFGWDWGPRFVTAGIWRAIRLEAHAVNRLTDIAITQEHSNNGRRVALALDATLVQADAAVRYDVILSLGDKVVVERTDAAADALKFDVPSPQLWWPAGQGEQPLYDLSVSARDAQGKSLGAITKRIGLRTIALDKSPDELGKKFQFIVNGRPIFIKGANWIPAHSFVADLTRADYERDLNAAVLGHMNCVRVWGGGIYEDEAFYDLCDELGLIVWQDFMFACNLFPSDQAFLNSVREEATYQLRRLRHRASIGLWCGNNELIMLNGSHVRDNEAFRTGYEALFHTLLPEVMKEHAPASSYTPSSEWRETYENGHEHGVREGDTHFWDVWHQRKPVKDYEKWNFRFCSEFGMQSYSSPQTNATFAPADANVFDAIMENHQKNRGGNQVILDYVSRRYRFPQSQDNLIYLSQMNQAYCMQVGVEHYRRTMPHCMGALYWQLNDCWPVASWSSIEFTGRWRALHYAARRFNAPALVSAHVPGDEGVKVGNYRTSNVGEVHLYTVYDAPQAAAGLLRWDLFKLDGEIVLSGSKKVRLRHNESTRQTTLDLTKQLAKYTRDKLYLRIALDVNELLASEQTVFLTPPRFIDLPKAKTRVTSKRIAENKYAFTFTSNAFQHGFAFEFGDLGFVATDNYFDLYPGEAKTVEVSLNKPSDAASLKALLQYRSLVNTY
jgi:beta-mannosidase